MARLNEAPVPTESVDALRRRFIRQNRELAKNNSTQSIRIRTLEADTSRLVAENLALREKVIQLETQLERGRNNHAVTNISTVKDKLEAKIQELGGLVAELGLLQKSQKSSKRLSRSPKQPANQRSWRNPGSLAEALAAQDGRLPTISEGKYYPRRTLEAEEIRTLTADPCSDSPDLGPPPVAHFQDEDPIKFDPQLVTSPTEETNNGLGETNTPPATLSANLETRRKRRDSKQDFRRMSVFQSPPEKVEEPAADQSLPIRTSAKRKLSARNEEVRPEPVIPQKEDFTFSRKATSGAEDGSVEPHLHRVEGRAVELAAEQKGHRLSRQELKHAPVILERKALGTKSVNTSPRRIVEPMSHDTDAEVKKLEAPAKDTSRSRIRDRKPKQPTDSTVIQIPPTKSTEDRVEVEELPVEESDVPGDLQSLPPKTPAGLDLFSPTSTAASTARPESNDTPPPTDLNPASALTSTAESNAGRAARRARANVNYAEPNLVSKMRRPTKELVDAVKSDGRCGTKENPVVVPASSTAETEQKKMRTVVIKRERDEAKDDAWRSLPAAGTGKMEEPGSPLSKKSTDMRGGAESDGKGNDALAPVHSSEDLSISDRPSAAARRKHSRISSAPVLTPVPDDAVKSDDADARDSLAVFDFAESSPTDSSKTPSDSNLAKARAPRRHSSITSLAPTSNGTTTKPNVIAVAPAWNKAGDEGGRSKALREMKQRASTEIHDAAENRNGRLMARRRSMML